MLSLFNRLISQHENLFAEPSANFRCRLRLQLPIAILPVSAVPTTQESILHPSARQTPAQS